MVETIAIVSEFLRLTPKIEDLLPNKQINCPESQCPSVFKNTAHLQMHLERHHRRILQPNSTENSTPIAKRYYCPVEGCQYFDTGMDSNAKFFGCLRYVRQHYQKVHVAKTFQCDECGKTFATDGMRARHRQDCGRVYKCDECGWTYGGRESLLTHARRKGHAIHLERTKSAPAKLPASNTVIMGTQTTTPIQILVKLSTDTQDQCVQTDPVEMVEIKKPTRRKRSARARSKSVTIAPKKEKGTSNEVSVFTEEQIVENVTLTESSRPESNFNRLNFIKEEDVEDSIKTCLEQLVGESSGLCHIETQTDAYSSVILDEMLYSHMHTQTCDEYLSELGLADIQTQTNHEENASMEDVVRHDTYSMTSGPYDEMLVSTETQTSFTQCLLEYNDAAGTSSSNGITQHTQTCETLLEGLFGAQENDLISSFQSTYTQT